jgi:chromodomain-helicase-DNA-binding protein 4
MANPSSDPLLLFTPPNLKASSPPPSELIASSLQESPQPEAKKPTRRKVGFYIEPPRLSPSLKKLYETVPDSLKGCTGFGRDDLDSVVGEYPLGSEGKPLYYFVRFKDGLAHRVSHSPLCPSRNSALVQLPAHQFKAQYSDLVDDYGASWEFLCPYIASQIYVEQRKEEGLLEPFDPSSNAVHEDFLGDAMAIDGVAGLVNAHTFSGRTISKSHSSPFSSSLSPLSSEEDVDRSDDGDFSGIAPTRRSTRAPARNKRLAQSQLPFSPKKLRSAHIPAQSGSDSGDDLGGYGQVDSEMEDIPTRRSDRSRKSIRSNLADDFVDEEDSDGDTYHDSPQRKSMAQKAAQKSKKKRSATARPAYGHFRDINDLDFDPYDEEATEALRAHRDICEKCHKYAAHELLKIARKQKKGRRKSRNNDDDDEHEEDDEERLQGLGGWVRWFELPEIYFLRRTNIFM